MGKRVEPLPEHGTVAVVRPEAPRETRIYGVSSGRSFPLGMSCSGGKHVWVFAGGDIPASWPCICGLLRHDGEPLRHRDKDKSLHRNPFSPAELDTMRALLPVLVMRRSAVGRAIEALTYLKETESVGEAAREAIEMILTKYDWKVDEKESAPLSERRDTSTEDLA